MTDVRPSTGSDLHASTAGAAAPPTSPAGFWSPARRAGRLVSPSLVLLAVLSLAAVSGVHAATSPGELAAFADAQLSAAYPAGEPGAAALVRWKGKVVLRKGYGLASVELAVPVTPEQVFEIGSVTKQFTAAGILMLAERGKLALSDPITKYLPDFPTGDQTVTLEHLLTHTSGVPSYTEMPEWVPRWREDMSLETLIGLFRGKPLEFVPGQRWSYSNSGYVLLGAVIEKASGKSYEELVETEIFAPLGMTHTRYGHQEELVPGRVEGYAKDAKGYAPAPYLSLTQPYSAGALMSTVDDLARWIDALEADELLTAAARQRMLTPATLRGGDQDGLSTRYGLGMQAAEIAGHAVKEHGGGIHGFASILLTVPDERLQVVILSNNPGGKESPSALARRIARKALGEAAVARVARTLGDQELDEYVGVYRVPAAAAERRFLTRDGATLRLQRTGGPIVPLSSYAADRFEGEDGTPALRFLRDAQGKVAAVEVDRGTGPIERSARTDEPLPAIRVEARVDPASYDALVGVYELAPGFDLTISRDGVRLLAQVTGQPALELFPESPTRFFLKEVDAQIDFVRAAGDDGPASGLVLHQGGRDIPGKRKP